ncbi:hypothetical protein HG531_008673 [Fusarium graminearum]|nr:hypothetical protein HG531_008673 [Fusarium graminearum]
MYSLTCADGLSLGRDVYVLDIQRTSAGLATISSDQFLSVLDPARLSAGPQRRLPTQHGNLTTLRVFDSNAALVCTAGENGTVAVWDLRQGANVVQFQASQAPIFSMACSLDTQTIAVGTELQNHTASIHLWDVRSTPTSKAHYQEVHSDDVTDLSFNPSNSALLLSGSTDGLVNVYDTRIADEDDLTVQTCNVDSSIHRAAWLSATEVAALTHDERCALYDVSEERANGDAVQDFGDMRSVLGCQYVADITPKMDGSGAVLGAGAQDKQAFELVFLAKNPNGEGWALDRENSVGLPGAHGDELVRSFCFFDEEHVVYTAGEDGNVLNDHSGSTTATVADTNGTDLGLPLLKYGGKGGDNTSTRAAERVADGNGTTVDVNLVRVKAEDLHVGEGNGREGLVDLVVLNLLGGQAGVLDSLGNSQSRSDSETLRLTLSITPTKNLGNGLKVELLELGLRNEDNGGGTIVDGGSVGSSDGTVRLESRAHGLELVNVQVLDLVVTLDLDGGLATATRDLDRDNLSEETSLSSSLGLLVRVDGVLVLSLTGEVVVIDTELSRDTHVVLLKGVGQTVLEDTVDEGLVAVLGTVSEVGEVVRSVGHGLGSTSNNDIGGAEHDVLGTKDDGLERRSADLVHGCGDDGLRETSAKGTLAGRALTNTGRFESVKN